MSSTTIRRITCSRGLELDCADAPLLNVNATICATPLITRDCRSRVVSPCPSANVCSRRLCGLGDSRNSGELQRGTYLLYVEIAFRSPTEEDTALIGDAIVNVTLIIGRRRGRSWLGLNLLLTCSALRDGNTILNTTQRSDRN